MDFLWKLHLPITQWMQARCQIIGTWRCEVLLAVKTIPNWPIGILITLATLDGNTSQTIDCRVFRVCVLKHSASMSRIDTPSSWLGCISNSDANWLSERYNSLKISNSRLTLMTRSILTKSDWSIPRKSTYGPLQSVWVMSWVLKKMGSSFEPSSLRKRKWRKCSSGARMPATKVPEPWTRSATPSSTECLSERWTVPRLYPSGVTSLSSDGRRSPGFNLPLLIFSVSVWDKILYFIFVGFLMLFCSLLGLQVLLLSSNDVFFNTL